MSDAFDKKFREKLSEGDIPFDADAWKKMEKKLDALNEDGYSGRSFWRWLTPLLLLLLGTGAFFWWRSSTSIDHPSPAASSNNTSTVPQQQTPVKTQGDTPEEKANTNTTDQSKQPAAVVRGEEQQAASSSEMPKTNKSATPAHEETAAAKHHTPSPLVDRTKQPADPVLSYPVNAKEQYTATGAERTGATKTAGGQDNILQLLATLQPKEEQLSTNIKGNGRSPLKQSVQPADEKTKEKKELPSRKGLSLTLTGGPVYNVAPSLQYGRLGVDGGLLLSYHVNNRWAFTTGAIYSQKPYGGTWRDYGVLKNWAPPDPYHVIRKIDANCGVLDVPVNINYAFMNRPNYTLSATAGLSSYLMLKEKYTYKYQSGWDSDKELTNANQHYLAVLNLAFTYQFPLNNNMSLGIQPFTKIPLRSVGYGEVRLYSTGVMLQLNFNSAGHKR
ncbi:outer membrane beta-barrel protein [uncultured Chitinophaga sp.]|jgi:hypothetical protein|uniref:outer membrane beta-barrel protein n=1 Tax=uncultured Chitinophaga sp. TaxID=339340 RepID=UPI002636264A|nr:outer membrane beta-barrel protein [uncultured Chitinophaga sp.]